MAQNALLPSSFMLGSIIGFFISLFAVYPAAPSFGFAFMVTFVIMFIASVVSMTRQEVGHRDMLYLHGMAEHAAVHRAHVKRHARLGISPGRRSLTIRQVKKVKAVQRGKKKR